MSRPALVLRTVVRAVTYLALAVLLLGVCSIDGGIR